MENAESVRNKDHVTTVAEFSLMYDTKENVAFCTLRVVVQHICLHLSDTEAFYF